MVILLTIDPKMIRLVVQRIHLLPFLLWNEDVCSTAECLKMPYVRFSTIPEFEWCSSPVEPRKLLIEQHVATYVYQVPILRLGYVILLGRVAYGELHLHSLFSVQLVKCVPMASDRTPFCWGE